MAWPSHHRGDPLWLLPIAVALGSCPAIAVAGSPPDSLGFVRLPGHHGYITGAAIGALVGLGFVALGNSSSDPAVQERVRSGSGVALVALDACLGAMSACFELDWRRVYPAMPGRHARRGP